jgi:sarcosine oxidase subunit beta
VKSCPSGVQVLSDVCIVGGGIQGCSTALALAKAGADVVVVERDYPGKQSSGLNAGGVRRMGRDPAEVPLSIAAHQRWLNIEQIVDDDCGFVTCANISIAETEDEFGAAQKHVSNLQAQGYNHETTISVDDVLELEPHIAANFIGAIYCPGDGFANPFQTTHAYFKKAQALGVTFHLQEEVHSVRPDVAGWAIDTDKRELRAATLVNCAGAWANHIASAVGAPAPVHKEAPMLMITGRTRRFMNSVLGFEGRQLSLKQRVNQTVLIGGGYRGQVNECGKKSSLDITGLRENAETVLRLFPFLEGLPIVRGWSGVEAMTPDGLPVISRCCRHENVFHAFGFSGHGFQLGPIVGEIISELITDGRTEHPIDAFDINRFQ